MTNEPMDDLSAALGRLAAAAPPDTDAYVDAIAAATRARRQRPAWSFASGWLPLEPVRLRPWTGRSRTLLVVALIVLGLVAGALLVGSRRTGPPPPFGDVPGGLIAYSIDGDILVLDPVTGARTPVLVGPDSDAGPEFSLDGRRLLFERRIDGQPWLYLAASDGSDAHPLLDQATVGVLSGSWTADGRVLMAHEVNGHQRISFFSLDGSGLTTLNLGLEATWPQLRPPGFQELLFRGVKDGRIDLYVVDTDGGTPRALGLPSPQLFGPDWDLMDPSFNADGSAFAYLTVDPADNDEHGQFRVHRYDMATGTDQVISRTGPTIQEAWPYWAPNGKWIAIQRWEWTGTGRVAIIPADGHDEGFQIDVGTPFDRQPTSAWISTWSPDSRQVLSYLDRTEAPILIDVETHTHTRPDWRFDEPPSWAVLGG